MKLYPNAKVFDDFELMDNGNGAYISKWNLNVPKPTIEQLNGLFDEVDLKQIKQKKIDDLDQSCKNAILDNFTATLNGVDYEFAYDSDSQNRFNGVGILFLGNQITEVTWTAYQNGQRVRINLTKDDFNIISLAALKHQNDNVTKYSDLYNKVNDATTVDEINAITW
jgi:hypothetical protein